MLNLLRSASQDEALGMLQRLRAGAELDVDSLFSQPAARGGEGSYRARSPESSSAYVAEQYLAVRATGIELELLTRYPIAYPTLYPIDADEFLLEDLPEPLSRPTSPVNIEPGSGDNTDMR